MNPILGVKRELRFGHHRPSQPIDPMLLKNRPTGGFAGPNDYISERDRFRGQAHELERQSRQAQWFRKQQSLQQRRLAKAQGYQQRWQQVEDEHQRDLRKLNVRASRWELGMKNNLSEAYNPITLEYDRTEQGRLLHVKDQNKAQRNGLRMFNLDQRQNCGYNPITGQARDYTPQLRRSL